MVIFGATGDLTKRLLIPALYNLLRTKVLPEKFALIGVARTAGTAKTWRNQLYGMLKSFIGNASAELLSTTLTRPRGSTCRKECCMSKVT